MGLSLDVGQAFYSSFRQLRPVQRPAIDPIKEGQDTVLLAGTGSGKTEAAFAPLVDRYLGHIREAQEPTILVVSPTRALANDLLRRLEPPLDRLEVTIGIRHGERDDLHRSRPPSILITTPESLDVLITRNEPRLKHVLAAVIDEVHLLYNSQRGFQLAVLLRRLETLLNRRLQVIGLSATVSDPKDLWSFLRPTMEPSVVRDESRRPIDSLITRLQEPTDLVQVIEALGSTGPVKVLLFTNSRKKCDELGALIRAELRSSQHVYVHHSSLSRDVRLDTERDFQNEQNAICLATSTLELGIDIGDIDVVLLYDHPGGWQSFLQRIGRGSRRAPKTNVICVVPDDAPPFISVLTFQALLTQVTSERISNVRPINVFGAVVQQILSKLLQANGRFERISDLGELFSGWDWVTPDDVERILDQLQAGDYVRRHGFQNRCAASYSLYRLRDAGVVWGNFPSRSQEVVIRTHSRELGSVPAINLLRLHENMVVLFAGRPWLVKRIAASGIEVEGTSKRPELDIRYQGPAAPLDPTVVEEMLRVLVEGPAEIPIAKPYNLDFHSALGRLAGVFSWENILCAKSATKFRYLTFAGRVMNEVVARWAGLSNYDAGEVILETTEDLKFDELPPNVTDLQSVASEVLAQPDELTIFQFLLPHDLLVRELSDVWLKTPIFLSTLARLRSAAIRDMPWTVSEDFRA